MQQQYLAALLPYESAVCSLSLTHFSQYQQISKQRVHFDVFEKTCAAFASEMSHTIEQQRQRVEQEITRMVDDLDKTFLRKMQVQITILRCRISGVVIRMFEVMLILVGECWVWMTYGRRLSFFSIQII